MDIANKETLQLRVAGLRIFESMALLGIAESNLYPQVQQIGGAVNYVNNQYHGGSPSRGDQSFNTYNLNFNLGWELDFWGRFQRSIESADATFFTSVANQQDMQVLISAQVADLYFAYRTTEARIVIAHNYAKIQHRSYQITEVLFSNDQQSELDLQQARTQYLSTLSTVPELELSLLKIRNALATLLGRPPGIIPELSHPNYQLPALSSESINKIPASLLNRRPDIRASAWQTAAQSAQIGIAETDYYPAISLLGTIGWSGNDLSNTAEVGTAAAGPSLKWNILIMVVLKTISAYKMFVCNNSLSRIKVLYYKPLKKWMTQPTAYKKQPNKKHCSIRRLPLQNAHWKLPIHAIGKVKLISNACLMRNVPCLHKLNVNYWSTAATYPPLLASTKA